MIRWLLGEISKRVCRLLCRHQEPAAPPARATTARAGDAPDEPRWHRSGDAWRSDEELGPTDRRPPAEPGPGEPRWHPAGDAWLGSDDESKD